MTDERRIQDTATAMLKQHGEEAIDRVVAKAEEALQEGDRKASTRWLHIADAINHLLLYRCRAPALPFDIAGAGVYGKPGLGD